MRSFSIKGFSFQIPFMLQETEKTMKLLEREYPECKNKKEMDEAIQREYKRGDIEELARDNYYNK